MNEFQNIFRRLLETKVLENYSFMTALSICSALIGLLIYPYVIRVVGKEMYGTYVYAITIMSYFLIVMDFGFDSPCAKAIVQAEGNKDEYSHIVSAVFTAKMLLVTLCGVVLGMMMYYVPFMRHHFVLCLYAFIQTIASILFPGWYFQGTKNMKIVTYINLSIRLLTIPFIIWLVHCPSDIEHYALIVMLSIVLGTLVAYIALWRQRVRIRLVSIQQVKRFYKEAFPFFVTNLTDGLKSSILKTVIKLTFGVSELAIYDMAEKLINIPHFFTQNINAALYPEVVNNASHKRVKSILTTERIIGLSCVILTILMSYPAVLLLGGEQMRDAIPVTMLLSITIYTWLISGAYINFVFVPQNRYYFVTLNQFVALLSCIGLMVIGLLLWKNIIVIALARVLSGIAEIIYCRYTSKRYKML